MAGRIGSVHRAQDGQSYGFVIYDTQARGRCAALAGVGNRPRHPRVASLLSHFHRGPVGGDRATNSPGLVPRSQGDQAMIQRLLCRAFGHKWTTIGAGLPPYCMWCGALK